MAHQYHELRQTPLSPRSIFNKYGSFVLPILVFLLAVSPAMAVSINEFVAEHTGQDHYEYFEISGQLNTSYSNLTLVQLDGDTSRNPGEVISATACGTTDSNGLWWTGYQQYLFQPGSLTLLLVQGFSSSVGSDLDTNNDGTLDSTPWTSLVDDVAIDYEVAGDQIYSTTVLSSAMDSSSYTPGGASRIPNATDTDSVSDWRRNDWDLAGIPGFAGTLSSEEALNTPGAINTQEEPPISTGMVINEWVVDHVGNDTNEFIEVFGSPNSSAASSSLLIVDGDDGSAGHIDAVYGLGTFNAGGYQDTGYLDNILSGSLTILLVSNFSGSVGDDLDTNDDGTFDSTPWGSFFDSVSYTDNDAGDLAYSVSILSSGGASRVPNGVDTDQSSDWTGDDFDGEGLLDGVSGTALLHEALNTPSWPNRLSVTEFYSGVDTSSETAARTTIHDTIDGHIRYDYTGIGWDVWDMINAAEEYPVGANSIRDLYKNEVYTKISGGAGAYNREHSWPNTYGFGTNNDGNYPYTDANHLFACDTDYNNDRSSRPFATCDGSCSEDTTAVNNGQGGGSGVYPGNSNWFGGAISGGSGIWETWNGRRGDVARAAFYMDVRYEGGTHPITGYVEPDLILTDDPSLIITGHSYMGFLSTLLQWNAEDPVDDAERRRNEAVSVFQTNRNPFIDHPEWVECVFEGVCSLFTDGFENGDFSGWDVVIGN